MKVLLFINRILKVFHLELNRLTKKNKIDPIHENLDFVKLLNLTRQKTLISEDRLFILYQCLISTTRLPGELAELGVYRGGSAILLSHIAKEFSPQKTLYLLDTFEGMPDTDANYDLHKKGDFNDTSIEAVKEYLKDCKNLIFLKGLFSDTLQQIENKTLK